MKIQTGDSVIVISGKDKGKQGTVMRVLEAQNRVVVEGINMRIRHIKKTTQSAGQRVSYEASLHASNVMIIDPKTKKPTRIGFKIDEKTGKKTRVARASGEAITKSATAKAAKTTKKSDDKKSDAKPASSKQPFWKRGEQGAAADSSTGSTGPDTGANVIQTAHRSQGG